MFAPADYVLRPLTPEDEAILWEMVSQALAKKAGAEPDPALVHQPEYAHYVEGWGGPHDQGVVARDKHEGTLLGATWLRAPLEVGPGDPPPELALVVRADQRQRGIGASLLTQLMRANPQMVCFSLKVGPDSPAVRLFERFGFEVAEKNDRAVVMRRHI